MDGKSPRTLTNDVCVRKERWCVCDCQSAKPQEDVERINVTANPKGNLIYWKRQKCLCSIWILKTCRWTSGLQLGGPSSAGSTSSIIRRIYVGLKNIGNTPKAQFDELSLNHHCRIALKSRVIFIFLKNKTKHMKCLLYILYCTKQ